MMEIANTWGVVLYYAEEYPELFSQNDENIKSIVDNTFCKDLKDFIINELLNDDDLLNRFKLFSNQYADKIFYIKKLKKSFLSQINVINFMDEDLNVLIQNHYYNLVLKLCKLIIDNLEDWDYNHEWDSFDNILDKTDSVMIRLLESDCKNDALEFLECIILTNDILIYWIYLQTHILDMGMLKSYLKKIAPNYNFKHQCLTTSF
ncbi:hypothetical protein [uncultured Methanobrevibacter sp.]|uniref:hypothetical protein n=1 Tax=uncultured Methanobrevibacter sp. TaxID=253161 RepID=UPI0025EFD34B|nr:hypothetical protein [uncultured Methanobrevibacter sp.]